MTCAAQATGQGQKFPPSFVSSSFPSSIPPDPAVQVLRGTVRDANGSGLGGVLVSASSHFDPGQSEPAYDLRTGPEGYFNSQGCRRVPMESLHRSRGTAQPMGECSLFPALFAGSQKLFCRAWLAPAL